MNERENEKERRKKWAREGMDWKKDNNKEAEREDMVGRGDIYEMERGWDGKRGSRRKSEIMQRKKEESKRRKQKGGNDRMKKRKGDMQRGRSRKW